MAQRKHAAHGGDRVARDIRGTVAGIAARVILQRDVDFRIIPAAENYAELWMIT